nr:MAG TPA: Plasmid like replication protein [Inoviridae sp.]
MKKDRFYRWSLVIYGNEEDVLKVCRVSQHYAYILHDKEEKEPHWHLLCTFKVWKSLASIKSIIDNGQNVLGEEIHDKQAAFRYLTHKDNPEKYQYEEEDVKSDNKEFWRGEEQGDVVELIDDIIEGMSFRDMAIKYGKDFVKNYRAYAHYAALVEAQETRERIKLLEEPAEMVKYEQLSIRNPAESRNPAEG